ncbi:DUF2652 domain-containing protein [Flavitalea antarctica]
MTGLIFIPDITGFTNFVCQVPPEVGAKITKDLLTEIIDNCLADLQLAEVEGDALLFYKLGEPLPLDQILASFRKIATAFNMKYQQLKIQHEVNAGLTLKFILHYGEIDIYHVKSFKKLYGKSLVESHRLLKNGFVGSEYLLITEDYIQALKQPARHSLTSATVTPQRITQHFSNLRNINYYFYDTHVNELQLYCNPTG